MEVIILALAVAVYFLPSIIALKRDHRNAMVILCLNIFLGWTFLGWIASLVWSLTNDTRR